MHRLWAKLVLEILWLAPGAAQTVAKLNKTPVKLSANWTPDCSWAVSTIETPAPSLTPALKKQFQISPSSLQLQAAQELGHCKHTHRFQNVLELIQLDKVKYTMPIISSSIREGQRRK